MDNCKFIKNDVCRFRYTDISPSLCTACLLSKLLILEREKEKEKEREEKEVYTFTGNQT